MITKYIIFCNLMYCNLLINLSILSFENNNTLFMNNKILVFAENFRTLSKVNKYVLVSVVDVLCSCLNYNESLKSVGSPTRLFISPVTIVSHNFCLFQCWIIYDTGKTYTFVIRFLASLTKGRLTKMKHTKSSRRK